MAMWTCLSKYGPAGPPLHMQPVQNADVLAAVAELSGSQLSLPAADESVVVEASTAPPSPPPLPHPVEPAPAEDPDQVVEPAKVVDPVPIAEPAPAEVPAQGVEPTEVEEPSPGVEPEAQIDTPQQGALKSLKPPAPSTPIDVSDNDDLNGSAVAVSAIASTTVAARHKINATLLALARYIRMPRNYIGYSAFLLMALRHKCQPCVWEGSNLIDLLTVFAPWAKDHCTRRLPVTAIPCALMARAGGCVECMPISDEHPLSKTCHFVAGVEIPETAVAGNTCGFELFYAQLGVATLATVVDGDCGIDVMAMMLGKPTSVAVRNDLRIEISDYLIHRINEPWMQQLMAYCQELDAKDVQLSSGDDQLPGVSSGDDQLPIAPPAAVAEPAEELAVMKPEEPAVAPDEETFAAMQWVSKLSDDSNVLSLIRSLPQAVVDEQVCLYKKRNETAVVAAATPTSKLKVNGSGAKLPWGAMSTFIKDHLEWTANQKSVTGKQIRTWYTAWRKSEANVLAAVADKPCQVSSGKCLLKSRATKPEWQRQRGHGGGRKTTAPLIRHALFEWWSGIRYAIDWTQFAAENRSRGKKHLARFPRSILVLKVTQLLEDHA